MKQFNLTFLLLLAGVIAYAQQTVSGIVKDEQSAIPSATVLLLHAVDSSLALSELTDENGSFTFKNVVDGNYLLDVRFVGYNRYLQPLVQKTGIEVKLVRSTSQLNEVVVKSTLPQIQQKMGQITVNFEQASIPAGNNVLELLRKAPGVLVDGNGNVSMNGKGVLITIDDKQTYLSGEDLNNYLQSIPAEQVAQFELMSQPTAKYDAEGNTGIINIKMRLSKKAGLSGNVALSYGQGLKSSTHNSANLRYKKDKLSMQANAGYYLGQGFLKQKLERTASDIATNTPLSHVSQYADLNEIFEDYSLQLGADYAFSDKVKAGGTVQGIYHPNKERDVTTGTITDFVNNTQTQNESVNERGFVRYNTNTTAYVKYKPADEQTITADFAYRSSDQQDGQLLTSRNYGENGVEQDDFVLKSRFPLSLDVYVAQADYAGKIKDLQVQVGIKAAFVDNMLGSFNEKLKDDIWVYDANASNNYIYKENINAAYVNVSEEISTKWQAQAGLRVEQTHINGLEETTGAKFDRSFTSCFPTAYVSYKADDKNTFEVNAGRRINRPSYRSLNPFVFYLSQYSSRGGNPNLLPSFRKSLELKHNYNNHLFSSISVARVNGEVNDVTIYDAVTKAVHFTMANNVNKFNTHFSCNYNQQIVPWWTLMAGYDWYYNDYEDYNGNAVATSHGHSVSINNQFSFSGWNIDTVYVLNSGDLQTAAERNGPNQWMNASVSKKIWKDSATIKLSANDPFAIYIYTPSRNSNGVVMNASSQFATQQFSLGFTYNFGRNGENAQLRNANSEEAGRM